MKDQWLLTVLSIVWLQSCVHVPVEARKHRRTKTTIEEALPAVRLPRNTDRLVYRYQNDSHIFVGFDNVKRRKVFTMLWKLKPTNAGKPFLYLYLKG